MSFTFMAKWSGERIYSDGIKKNNHYIREIFPQIYYIDVQRNLRQFQKDILLWMENDQIRQMRSDVCMFDRTKKCRHCFDCMGVISKKAAGELNAL